MDVITYKNFDVELFHSILSSLVRSQCSLLGILRESHSYKMVISDKINPIIFESYQKPMDIGYCLLVIMMLNLNFTK